MGDTEQYSLSLRHREYFSLFLKDLPSCTTCFTERDITLLSFLDFFKETFISGFLCSFLNRPERLSLLCFASMLV